MNPFLVIFLGWVVFFVLVAVISNRKKNEDEKPLREEDQEFVDQMDRELNLVYKFAEYLGEEENRMIKNDPSGLPDSYENIVKAFVTFFEVFGLLGQKGSHEWNLVMGCATCLPSYNPNFKIDERTATTTSAMRQILEGAKGEETAAMVVELAKSVEGVPFLEKIMAEAAARIGCSIRSPMVFGLLPRVPLVKKKFFRSRNVS
jgi:hypothetical protein